MVIPDYKIYVVNEHTPELQALEKKLAERGLKDPWIRNEVWRYDMRDRVMTNELVSQTFSSKFHHQMAIT